MNFPRFSNPHLRAEQFEVISRSDLLESDTENAIDAKNIDDVHKLDALVKRTLGDFAGSEPPRKKRKRKDTDTEVSHTTSSVVSFRLLSSAPVREYNLLPKPHPEINNEGPPCEDDENSIQLRRQRAAATAVDHDWVIREGRAITAARLPSTVLEIQAALPDTPPPLALLERPRSIPPVRLQLTSSAKPSPHEARVASACPLLSFSTLDTPPASTAVSETARRRMRRQKKREHEKPNTRPSAMFWRPSLSIHGRIGYAMGYEGSWAVEDDAERSRVGYVRDNMKKAVWAASVV
ncbi:unnamed protein product [Peniophora sp. CBMAI 1063]|nr:unnamed protein product [Peniophora sp. CBMAI 1063]